MQPDAAANVQTNRTTRYTRAAYVVFFACALLVLDTLADGVEPGVPMEVRVVRCDVPWARGVIDWRTDIFRGSRSLLITLFG